MGLQSPTAQQLKTESWSMYSVGLVFILLRLYVVCPLICPELVHSSPMTCRYSRKLVLGSWKRLQVEDYLMAVDLVLSYPARPRIMARHLSL